MPTPKADKLLPKNAPISVAFNTAPNAPPAPVINKIGADTTKPWLIRSLNSLIFWLLFNSDNDKNKPIIKALTGWPKNTNKSNKPCSPSGFEGKLATEPKQIKMIGTKIGANALVGLGNSP